MRLALLYAVLDGRHQIGAEHLAAALEVWRYCDESACYVFGDATGDTVADEVLTALRNAGAAGVTRTDISRHFQRHRSSDRIGVALTVLDDAVLAKCVREATLGRPVERWFAVEHTSAPVGGLDE